MIRVNSQFIFLDMESWRFDTNSIDRQVPASQLAAVLKAAESLPVARQAYSRYTLPRLHTEV
jgi:hypothetical protein